MDETESSARPSRLLPILTLLLLTAITAVSAARAQEEDSADDGLPVGLLLAAMRAGEGSYSAHAWLEVPGDALGQNAPSTLLFRLRALNSVGAEEGSFERSVILEGETAERARDAGIKVHGEFPLAPGAYTLELTVTGDGSLLAERRFPFALAPWESGRAAVLPPFFIDDLEAHAVVRPTTTDPVTDPFRTGAGETFVPVVVPVISKGETRARVTLVGYHLTGEKNLLEARLFTADGDLLGKDRLGLVAQSETAPDGLDRLDFSLGTEGLAPGDYQLEVSIQDLAHGRTDETLMPFRIE